MTCESDESILRLFFLLWFILNVIFKKNVLLVLYLKMSGWGEGVCHEKGGVIAHCDASGGELCCVSHTLIRHQETHSATPDQREQDRRKEHTESATSCLFVWMHLKPVMFVYFRLFCKCRFWHQFVDILSDISGQMLHWSQKTWSCLIRNCAR